MYKGEIVEKGPADALIQSPVHPYTQSLLSAVPVLKGLEEPGPDRYIPLKELDNTGASDAGCLFAPRCPYADARCRTEHPLLAADAVWHHDHACFYPQPRRVVPILRE